MSERASGGFGAFLLGIVLGAVAGFVFAPESGEQTRRKVTKGLRNLKELAEEKVDDVRGLLQEAVDEAEEDGDEEPELTTREQLRRRLDAARRRRARATRSSPSGPPPPAAEEEDEPLA